MRKLSVAIAATALVAVGAIAWNAEAQTWRGAASLNAQNYTPIVKVRTCAPSCGFHRKWHCDRPHKCHCVPC
jgi:hypothetical protein